MKNSIKKLREKKGWTQQDLADKAKMDQANLSQYENDKKLMRQDTIIRLCLALDCTATQLLKESK